MSDTATSRTFQIGNAEANKQAFANNSIQTAKYSAIPLSPNFALWKNLFEQFHRYANIYFLVVAILQLIPGLSPTGKFTTIIPLSMVLFVTFLKDSYEDYKRHVRDREVNGQRAQVWRSSKWESVLWKDIVVGELVRVSKHESKGEFPSDMILLWSSEEQGLCHIETSNLDGETNLKLRKIHSESSSATLPPFSMENPSAFQGKLECEPPNKELYKFEGKLVRDNEVSAIDVVSLLLRGAKLGGSTREVIGVSVYTGKQSKLMMNQQDSRHKKSSLELLTNSQIIFIFACQLGLCTLSAIGLGLSTAVFTDHWYLAAEGISPFIAGLTGIATFIILFNNLIPISLYVSMEMVKIIQARLMNSDLDMYHEESDTPADAKTSSLNEELGQVQYIFSDKTGTLTCNIMDFLKFSVGNMSYGTGTTEIGRAAALREGKVLNDDRPANIKLVKGFFFYDDRVSDVRGDGKVWNWMMQDNAADLGHFLKVLAVCHTVVTEKGPTGEIEYTAASPDEACLVSGAKFLGIEFASRDATHINISVHNKQGGTDIEAWQFLEVLEFNSDRKRMSIVVRDPQGTLRLLCKGADTVIYQRLCEPENEEERQMRANTLNHLERFAADGLRTLCIAEVVLSEAAYNDWAPRYKQAAESVGDREAKVSEAAELIEKNLKLIGTTAIEDKLQEGVPRTIELLRTAGLNVWVLTGDKQETAINIGFACALLHTSMKLFKFEEGQGGEQIAQSLRDFKAEAEKRSHDTNMDLGVVVQGASLTFITDDDAPKENKDNFIDLTAKCKAVICCRVTPGQKAEVVRVVKDYLKKVTLSIGDGANDVAMINEAHVGIGISGLEGLQAARASDYSIGQFRFLQRLLLIHGRWSYKRVSKVILYSFYKNILLYLTQFWFCLFNSWTGKSLYDRWSLAAFNVAFTALPIMAVGVFDRDIESERILSLEQFPELYDLGRESQFFNTLVFWKFTVNALFQSAVCFFIPMLALQEAIEDSSGRTIDQQWFGITAYSCVVWVVTLKCALETTAWTWPNHLATWGSLSMWYIFLVVYGNMWPWTSIGPDWYLMYSVTLVDSKHWLTVILAVVIALCRDVTWKFYGRTFRPTLLHKVQEWEKLHQNGMLGSFGYRLMKHVCPEVLPRTRVKAKKRRPRAAPVDDTPAPINGTGHPEPAVAGGDDTARQPLLQDHLQPYPAQYPAQRYEPADDYSVMRSLPVKTADGHTAPKRVYRHTGYAFSQSDEGNQVEIMASRIPDLKSVKWAHGVGRRRVETGPSGQLSVSGSGRRSAPYYINEDDFTNVDPALSTPALDSRQSGRGYSPRALEGRDALVSMSGTASQNPLSQTPVR
eukprot:TRINITY_DN380_c0_g5_i1.p1 TRINITY_DN380_c0_g5~~TRINITY_DN380_c0_g5_i1.p1  ORF type:complete len:1339 (+),score=528.07 TRINITY_DN380_c0_g5_i1:76-4092(+)